MIGIYKITSPSKKVYIGQSVDIEKRLYTYKFLHCKKQPRLYRSLKKHGVDKHKFEILCECSVEELNDKERYYQDIFSATDKNGLNCSLTKSSDKSGNHSEESRKKMSEANKGKIISYEHRRKLSEIHKGNKYNLGYKHSEETKLKMSEVRKGYKHSEETKIKMGAWQIGKKLSEETKLKISNSRQNISEETRKKMSEWQKGKIPSELRRKLILNIETGIFYYGIKEAAKTIEIKEGTLRAKLSGINKNNTKLIYV